MESSGFLIKDINALDDVLSRDYVKEGYVGSDFINILTKKNDK